MTRYFADCREMPSEMNCTVAISADSKKELLEAAMQHVVAVHGHEDTRAMRKEIESSIKQGMPAM